MLSEYKHGKVEMGNVPDADVLCEANISELLHRLPRLAERDLDYEAIRNPTLNGNVLKNAY